MFIRIIASDLMITHRDFLQATSRSQAAFLLGTMIMFIVLMACAPLMNTSVAEWDDFTLVESPDASYSPLPHETKHSQTSLAGRTPALVLPVDLAFASRSLTSNSSWDDNGSSELSSHLVYTLTTSSSL